MADIQIPRGRHGWTAEDLAHRWGVSTGTVHRWKAAGTDTDTSPQPIQQHAIQPEVRPTRARRAATTVGARRLTEVLERWEKQCGPDGLDLDAASALLAELRGLLPSAGERAA